MALPALKKFLPKRRESQLPAIYEAPSRICENCGHSFTGHFCPMCGQKGGEWKKSLVYIMGHFFNHFFSLDNKTLVTIKRLFYQPGQLTMDYISGQRVSHTPPFRLFLFISFLFFFILNQFISFKDQDSIEVNIQKATEQDTVKATISPTALTTNLLEVVQSPEKAENFESTLETQIKKTVEEGKKSKKEKDDKEVSDTAKMRQALFLENFLNNSSKFILILLPFMALLFQLLFFKRNKYYLEHLLLSVNLHSLLFLQAALLILFSFFLNMSTVWGLWFFLFVPLYFIRAFRNFYKVSYKRAVVYFSAISFIYGIFFAILNVLNMVWIVKEKEYIFDLGEVLDKFI